MKVTNTQIEKVINNTFEFGIDGTESMYEAVSICEDAAIQKVGIEVKKTQHYFSKSDWKKVYSEIKKMIA
jgi:hypothetical protein